MNLRRPRRNRKNSSIRSLVKETYLHTTDLIYPLFVTDGKERQEEIPTLQGIYRLSIDGVLKECEEALKLGIVSVALFPVIEKEKKDPLGKEASNPDGVLIKAIATLKKEFPDLCLITDVALDPYTSHGHDGVLDKQGDVDNDKTIDILCQMALIQAEAGVDMVAPSDMMDGRVKAIRTKLDSHEFHHVNIHAYSAKYASCFYSPFRDALGSSVLVGNKKTYQLNPANKREAILEAILDEEEGADILMVKPAIFYLDIISKLRESTHLPISAFQVSGEYAMIMAGVEKGWLNKRDAFFESLLSIKRAGADMIFTYAALDMARSGVLD